VIAYSVVVWTFALCYLTSDLSSLAAQSTDSRESDAAVRVIFDAQFRVRSENWTDFGFSSDPARDDTFVLGRVMLGADVRAGAHLHSYIQARSSFLTDRDLPGGKRAIDADHLDFQNAFIDLVIPVEETSSLTVRAGRQELLLGRQRLVSPLDWVNTRRTFDGVRAIVGAGEWQIHAFFVRPVLVEKSELNSSDDDTDFFGLHATHPVAAQSLEYDLYWLALDRESAAFNETTGHERRHTFGIRLNGKVPDTGWDYDGEIAYQIGDISDADISAFMIGGILGHTFLETAMEPRLHAGFDLGSGDDVPGGDVGTFNQLFPLGHAYLGWIDIVGRQNVVAVNSGVRLEPLPRLTVMLTGHRFWRASDEDALYNAGGGIVRRSQPDGSTAVGSELDLLARYRFHPTLTGLLGYSRFFTDQFIEETGEDDDPQLFYLSMEWKPQKVKLAGD
jgi:hypothetical protein